MAARLWRRMACSAVLASVICHQAKAGITIGTFHAVQRNNMALIRICIQRPVVTTARMSTALGKGSEAILYVGGGVVALGDLARLSELVGFAGQTGLRGGGPNMTENHAGLLERLREPKPKIREDWLEGIGREAASPG